MLFVGILLSRNSDELGEIEPFDISGLVTDDNTEILGIFPVSHRRVVLLIQIFVIIRIESAIVGVIFRLFLAFSDINRAALCEVSRIFFDVLV